MTTRDTKEARETLQEISRIARQLAALRNMTVSELRDKYRQVYGEPTRSRNKDYLRKQVAWRIQELAEGGLSERALARIEELAENAPARWRRPRGTPALFPFSGERARARDARLPAVGSVISRTYQGTEYLVTVRHDGFEYNGRVYSSLSAAARAITGNRWNGFLFFKLQKQSTKNGRDGE